MRRMRAGLLACQSPLDGVPVTSGEHPYRQAIRRDWNGSQLTEPKAVNSPVADRLREAGLVLVGSKTALPDFGMLSSGQSSFAALPAIPGTSRNPGGSSSGAGAACAAGCARCTLVLTLADQSACQPVLRHLRTQAIARCVPIVPPTWTRVADPMARTVLDALADERPRVRILITATSPDLPSQPRGLRCRAGTVLVERQAHQRADRDESGARCRPTSPQRRGMQGNCSEQHGAASSRCSRSSPVTCWMGFAAF